MVAFATVLVLYGLLRYLVATDRDEAMVAIVAVLVIALITGSTAATLAAAVIAFALLLALRRLNRA
ncbi:MAG: hypothetical protein ACJ76Z_03800 [Thermoleophilaceae bacterium]